MRKKHYGICAICGKEKELTFEHVPPKSAFNSKPSKYITGDELIKSITIKAREPWDITGLRYKSKQQGMGYYRLCNECNNNFGAWYVPYYLDFVRTMHDAKEVLNPSTNTDIHLKIKGCYPLRIFKQIMCMFCTLNNSYFNDENLQNFLLDKENNNFDKDKYKVALYLFKEGIERQCGLSAMLLGNKQTIVLSEIGVYPIGMILYIDSPEEFTQDECDITSFVDCDYNELCNIEIKLPVRECNIMLPRDFRTKDEIIKMRKDNKIKNS